MKKLLLVTVSTVILISIPIFLYAASFPNEDAVKTFTDRTMITISSGDIVGAFNVMKPYFPPGIESKMDAVAAQIESRTVFYATLLGTVLGFEFIDSRKIGDSLLRLRYLVKRKNTGMIWDFIFYKNSDGWVLNDVTTDDKLEFLFDKN